MRADGEDRLTARGDFAGIVAEGAGNVGASEEGNSRFWFQGDFGAGYVDALRLVGGCGDGGATGVLLSVERGGRVVGWLVELLLVRRGVANGDEGEEGGGDKSVDDGGHTEAMILDLWYTGEPGRADYWRGSALRGGICRGGVREIRMTSPFRS